MGAALQVGKGGPDGGGAFPSPALAPSLYSEHGWRAERQGALARESVLVGWLHPTKDTEALLPPEGAEERSGDSCPGQDSSRPSHAEWGEECWSMSWLPSHLLPTPAPFWWNL